MIEAAAQPKQQIYANLKALQQQLEEITIRKKQSGNSERGEHREVQGPVLVIRGK